MKDLQPRVPPHSIDAEQSVLGGLLLVPAAWAQVSDLITQESFYRQDHQLIYRAMKALHDAGRRFDAVTLGDWLRNKGYGEQVGNGAYLIELTSTTPSTSNLRAYAEIVRDKAYLRRVIDVGVDIVDSAFGNNGRDPLEIISTAQSSLGGVLADQPCELEAMGPVMTRVFDRLEVRSRTAGAIAGITTGIVELDELINGLQDGQLVIIAARPKMGKTTLAQNICEVNALKHGRCAAIFSFEMQPEELGERMLSSVGGIDGNRVRRGELDDMDWANTTEVMKRLHSANLHVSRPKNARVETVVAQAHRMAAKKPLDLVVVDYLQLMQTRGDNRAQELGEVSRALKLLASELNCPVILLSQLNRKLEERPDKRPVPSDLRDSGAIEQDADVVIFIYRDEIYNKTSRYKGTAEIIVALQRNGPPGTVRALYRPWMFRFDDLPSGWEPEEEPTTAKRGSKSKNAFDAAGARVVDK